MDDAEIEQTQELLYAFVQARDEVDFLEIEEMELAMGFPFSRHAEEKNRAIPLKQRMKDAIRVYTERKEALKAHIMSKAGEAAWREVAKVVGIVEDKPNLGEGNG